MTERSEGPEDPLISGILSLPQEDVDPAVANRIRLAALAHFSAGARAPGLWTRLFEPAIVAVSVFSYLTWTAHTLATLHAASREPVAAAVTREK